MILIDGSDGGGQILRTAVAMSAITGKPCKISSIRGGRPNPGLQAQHLSGIEAAAKMCNAELKGSKLGSMDVEFHPGKISGGKYSVDTGTAGSVTLVLQTLFPICLFADAECEIEVIGGTDVKWSPPVEYFKGVFLDNVRRMGANANLEILKYGFYPKGGGKVVLSAKPSKLNKTEIVERGKLERIDIVSIASDNLRKGMVAERQIKGAEGVLKHIGGSEAVYATTMSAGSSVHAHAHFGNCTLGSGSLGEIGKKAEIVGEECALMLKKQMESGACADEWMADQLLPFMALAGDSKISVSKVTDHCRNNIAVIERFLPVKFCVSENVISVTRL